MNSKLRPSGIDGLGDMAWGTHFCLVYETKEDLLDFFIPFLKAGLENQEACLCVASEPLIAEEAERAMRGAFREFDQYRAAGQIEITPHTDWYRKDGRFDEKNVLQGWIDKLDQALARGFSGLRFAANISLEKPDWQRFTEYERNLDATLRDLRITGLCAYDLNRYSAASMFDVIRHHQFTLARRNGAWELVEGAELKRAHEEVLKLNNELEQRVIERTTELAITNEQLKTEIVERKLVEDALRESEEKFAAAFRASPIGLVIATVDGKYVEVNQALCDLLGYSREELLGRTAVEIGIFSAETREEWVKALERDGNMIMHQELSFQLPNGISRTTFSSMEMITLHGVPHRLSTVLDITERKGAEETIRKSEQLLREAESLGHTGSWEQNLVTGEILNTEENLRLFFGDDHSKGADFEDYAEIVHPDDREYVLQRRVQLLAEGGPRDIEYRVVWPDGSLHVIFGRATVVYDELGQAVRVYGTNVDITERKQAEEEIRRYATRMEALAGISRTFVEAGLDYQSVLNTVVRRTVELIGDSCVIRLFSTENQQIFPGACHHPDPKALSLLKEALRKRVYEKGIDTKRFHKLLAGESIYIPVVDPAEYRAQVQPEFWAYLDTVGVSSVLSVPLKAQGRVIGALSISRDRQGASYTPDDLTLLQNIADQAAMSIQNARLYRQGEDAREQLEALSRRLLEVQESERRALTTELHDRVGQSLTGLSILLQNIKALLSDETGRKLAAKFDDAQALVENTTRQIRDIMAELHLPELEDYGLAVALETYAERAASRGNLGLIADLPDLAPPQLPSEIRIALFRAAQEAISNVLKHAAATQLKVILEEEDSKIRLMIQDNGRGFDQEAVSQQDSPTWGWTIMRERIESIGGKVHIESTLGAGTRVIFEIERPS